MLCGILLRGMSSGVRLMGLICLLVHFLSVYQGPTLCRCLASAQDGADLLPALRLRMFGQEASILTDNTE